MSPLEVEILIHCCVKSGPVPDNALPVVKQALEGFVNAGAITYDGLDRYIPTDLGSAWLKAICSVTPPVKKFFDRCGKEIL